MTGLMPSAFAAFVSATAPASEPWSVRLTAGISSSAARFARSEIRHAPSRIEYSEWTWRWTKGTVSGTARTILERPPDDLIEVRLSMLEGGRYAAPSGATVGSAATT